jgi:hypothetical protein
MDVEIYIFRERDSPYLYPIRARKKDSTLQEIL